MSAPYLNILRVALASFGLKRQIRRRVYRRDRDSRRERPSYELERRSERHNPPNQMRSEARYRMRLQTAQTVADQSHFTTAGPKPVLYPPTKVLDDSLGPARISVQARRKRRVT